MSVPIALPTAVAYGVADFAGGLAARRAPVLVVTAVVQLAGLLALLPVALLVPGQPVRAGPAPAGWPASPGPPGCCSTCGPSRSARWAWWRRCRPWSGPGCRCSSGVLRRGATGPVTLLAVAVALLAIVLATAGTGRDDRAPARTAARAGRRRRLRRVLHRPRRDPAGLRAVAAGRRPGGHRDAARRAGRWSARVDGPADPADDRQRGGGHRGQRRLPAGHPAR